MQIVDILDIFKETSHAFIPYYNIIWRLSELSKNRQKMFKTILNTNINYILKYEIYIR